MVAGKLRAESATDKIGALEEENRVLTLEAQNTGRTHRLLGTARGLAADRPRLGDGHLLLGRGGGGGGLLGRGFHGDVVVVGGVLVALGGGLGDGGRFAGSLCSSVGWAESSGGDGGVSVREGLVGCACMGHCTQTETSE